MNGSTGACAPEAPAGAAPAARGGTGTVSGPAAPPGRRPGPSDAPAPVPPPCPVGTTLAGRWPLGDFLELGALPGAVPCARHYARHALREWALAGLCDDAEMVVSELVTNAICAVQALGHAPSVRLWLLADQAQVLILVWDASPELPVRLHAGPDAA